MITGFDLSTDQLFLDNESMVGRQAASHDMPAIWAPSGKLQRGAHLRFRSELAPESLSTVTVRTLPPRPIWWGDNGFIDEYQMTTDIRAEPMIRTLRSHRASSAQGRSPARRNQPLNPGETRRLKTNCLTSRGSYLETGTRTAHHPDTVLPWPRTWSVYLAGSRERLATG